MVEQTQWVERKFNFDFPVGLAPVIFERLRGTIPRIESATAGLPRESLIAKPDGKWSIQEQIGHLHDLDSLHDGRIDDFLAAQPELRPADITNAKTAAAGYNNLSYRELIENFRRSRDLFLERVEDLDAKDFERMSVHPRLRQPMRLVDMLYFVAEHDDHHIAMIRSIIKKLSHNKNLAR